MLSMTKPIGEDREVLQAHVDELFALFKSRIQEGRPYFQGHSDKLDELATGEIYTAEQARRLKLVDKIGFIEDAIERVAILSGLDSEKVRAIRYNRPESLLDIPAFAQTRGRQSELNSLLELSAPKAYYIATSLPPLVRSGRAE